MRLLADALHARGRRVTVLAPDQDGAAAYDLGLPYAVRRYRGRSHAEKLVGIWARCLLRESGNDYTVAALWFPSGLSASLVPAIRRGKLGILVHGSEVCRPPGFKQALMKETLTRADAVIVNSSFTKALVTEAGVERAVHIIPCGVEEFEVEIGLSGSPIILAVGRLIERKGFDRLLDAMLLVLQERPDAICEIVGDGPDRSRLERQARALGILKSVHFLGMLDDPALRKRYARASCFALPVRRQGYDVEGFGIVYLEAAMAGLPVIGGRDSGACDAIADGETGFIVDGTNPVEIANALLALLGDPERARKMGLRGRQRALRGFTWAENARRIDDIMTASGGSR